MLGITLTVPIVGMGVFTDTFSSVALLISTICLAVAEMPAFIPRTSSAIGTLYVMLPLSLQPILVFKFKNFISFAIKYFGNFEG